MAIANPVQPANSSLTDATDNPTTYSSGGTWQAAANKLYAAGVLWSYSSGAGTSPSDVSGGGISTYVSFKKKIFPTAANRVLELFRGMSASPGAAAATVITRGSASMTGCVVLVLEIDGVDTSGSMGSGAIVQAPDGAAIKEDAVTTFATPAALASFGDATHNMALAFWAKVSTGDTQTADTGYTLVGNVTQATSPALQIRSQYHLGEDTSINFTNSVARDMAMIAFELKAAVAGGGVPRFLPEQLGLNPYAL